MVMLHNKMLYVWYWYFIFFFFKQKTAYEMRISDWSSDVCSSDLVAGALLLDQEAGERTLLGRQRGKDIVRHGELPDGGPAIVSFARPAGPRSHLNRNVIAFNHDRVRSSVPSLSRYTDRYVLTETSATNSTRALTLFE